MPVFENSIQISRSVLDTFNVVSDYENATRWMPGLIDVRLTSASPIRAGSIVTLRQKFLGRTAFINADVVDYQRNKVIKLNGSYMNFGFIRTITFVSSGRETTIRDHLDIRTGWMVWYHLLLRIFLKPQLAKEWDSLKQFMESHGDKGGV